MLLETIVAVFPLPKMVVFPGQTISLHIFEPRYRHMVNYCLKENMHLALCHPQKLIKETPKSPSIKKAINSNHNTYSPSKILSSGIIEIKKIFPDGRYLLDLHLKERIQILEIIQEVPFYLAKVEPLESIELDPLKGHLLYKNLVKAMYKIFGKQQKLVLDQFLQSFQLTNLESLLIKFFEIGILPVSILQKCLKENCIETRAEIVLDILDKLTMSNNWDKEEPIPTPKKEEEGKIIQFIPST